MAREKPTREMLLAERDATFEHQAVVRQGLKAVANQLIVRGRNHDKSKLTDKELPYFAMSDSLKKLPYGSEKYYEQFTRMLKPAVTHHHANNRHHPEYHENGIADMNLVDMTEMVVDWNASAERQGGDHNVFKSINHNRTRFRIKKDMAQLLWNTALDVLGEEPEAGYEMPIIMACVECGEWFDPQHAACQSCHSHYVIEV